MSESNNLVGLIKEIGLSPVLTAVLAISLLIVFIYFKHRLETEKQKHSQRLEIEKERILKKLESDKQRKEELLIFVRNSGALINKIDRCVVHLLRGHTGVYVDDLPKLCNKLKDYTSENIELIRVNHPEFIKKMVSFTKISEKANETSFNQVEFDRAKASFGAALDEIHNQIENMA